MKILTYIVAAASLCVGLLFAATVSAEDNQPLFNGRDLSGWKVAKGPADSWRATDGLLSCTGKGSGWLATESEFGDFELSLEFRVPTGGNSGVFVRAPLTGEPHIEGMEIQVLDDHDAQYANLKPTQYCGSLYAIAPAVPRSAKKPGDWQSMVILCQGDHVRVTLNDTPVVDVHLADHEDKAKELPGIKRPMGHIGLQNHASGVDYRKISLRPLSK